MKTIGKILMWLFLWPILLPIWLWRRGKAGKVLAGVWALLFLCLVVAAMASFRQTEDQVATTQPTSPSSATGEPTAVSTAAERKDTSAPTATPVPTDTPTATNTPTPTSTPTATGTSTATPATTATATLTPTATATPTATLTPVATSTPTVMPTSTPTATIAPAMTGLVSGALGLSRNQWEQNHVRGVTDVGFTEYDDGQYSILFQGDLIGHIERNYRKTQVSLDVARKDATALIPEDSRLVETYSPPNLPELVVDLYHSESLKGRFPGDVWIGGEPGDFIAVYGVFDGKVPRTVIALGNNP